MARVVVAQLRLKPQILQIGDPEKARGKGGGGSTEIETDFDLPGQAEDKVVARVVVAQLRLKLP